MYQTMSGNPTRASARLQAILDKSSDYHVEQTRDLARQRSQAAGEEERARIGKRLARTVRSQEVLAKLIERVGR
jgi:hypothetical protein